jgi:hypothetical protein
VSKGDFVDADGNPLPAWQAYFGSVWAHANSDAKVGQLDSADLKNFETMINMYSRLAAGVSSLPIEYFGLSTRMHPPSAEGQRAGETRLIKKAERRQTSFGHSWEAVNRLVLRFRDGDWNTDARRMETLWRDAGTPTQAQVTDAIVKEYQSGLTDWETAQENLGRSFPETIAADEGHAPSGTKTAVGAGFAREQALQAGQAYLGVIVKTLIADASRGADKVSATGKGYTYYVRVVGGSACSRCAILAGIRSAPEPFARHVSCQCTAAPVEVPGKETPKLGDGLFSSAGDYFDSLSASEQDRVFTQAGAEAIRNGADITQVVNARRGADGIGYASHGGGRGSQVRGHFVKTTIGYRPDGSPVRVYTTTEGTTARGQFGKQQIAMGSTGRVRLMPETIMQIAGHNKDLAQAFLRDAGYLEYPAGHTPDWFARGLPEQQRRDRAAVDRATLRYGNFTLG